MFDLSASRLCGDPSSPGVAVVVTISGSYTVSCSDENLRPVESWILQTHCQNFVLCHSGSIFKVYIALINENNHKDIAYRLYLQCD